MGMGWENLCVLSHYYYYYYYSELLLGDFTLPLIGQNK
jgi:hypothetical protein